LASLRKMVGKITLRASSAPGEGPEGPHFSPRFRHVPLDGFPPLHHVPLDGFPPLHGFLWLETDFRFRGIKGGNAAGWGVEAAVGRGEQRGIGGWFCGAVIRGLDWCGGDASSLIVQVWQLQSLEGCSSLASRTGVGSRVRCCGCAAGMHVDACGEFQLRGRSGPRCAAWVFGRAAAAGEMSGEALHVMDHG